MNNQITRRTFLRTTSAAGGAILVGRHLNSAVVSTLPSPARSGINHVVVVMMENRSFDHMLGWMPNVVNPRTGVVFDANGKQAGLSFLDSNGGSHASHPLGVTRTDGQPADYQGCAFLDPGHSYTDGRVQYHGAACDGFLLNGSNSSMANPNGANDIYAIGYYEAPDLAFYSKVVNDWTTCDNYFAGIMAETYPNRFHMHAAQTDRLTNTSTVSTLPTIWDRLASRGLTGRYYYSDVPFLALWGSKYAGISKPFSQFLTEAATGRLPNVAFVDPRFVDEGSGTSGDDHPHADIRDGQVFLNRIYDALRTSPQWSSTVLVINYDEWGGFFDHVVPPAAPIPTASAAAGDNSSNPAGNPGLLGFRTPCFIISPFARRGFVAHQQFDHTSVLKLIEWRWSLPPLTVRDQTANNLAEALDFSSANATVPAYTLAAGPFGSPCSVAGLTNTAVEEDWGALRALALSSGFQI